MKTIKINFVDFWNINKEDNIITNLLKRKYKVIISDEPDYIFCSIFGNKHFKYKKSIKILILGENMAPDFNLYDYAIGFYDISYEDRYLKYNILLEQEIYNIIKSRTRIDKINDKFCAFVYGKDGFNSKRTELFNKLNEYKKVDSGGKYLNNIDKKIGSKKQDKIDFQKQYKFVIACENQQFPNYNTEKLFEAFASRTIPIYWGDPKISDIYNEKAFINCNNYTNIDDVLNTIIELDSDNKKYLKMINEDIFNPNYSYDKEQIRLEKFLYNIMDKDFNLARKVEFSSNYYSYKFYIKFFPIMWIYDIYLRILKLLNK